MTQAEKLASEINARVTAIRNLTNKPYMTEGRNVEAFRAAEEERRHQLPVLLADLAEYMGAHGFRASGNGYLGPLGSLRGRYHDGCLVFSRFESAREKKAEQRRVARNLANDRAMETEL